MIRTLFFLIALTVAQTVSCQAVFQRSYGGYGSDYGRAVIECSDGGYLVVGSTNSFVNESTDIYLLRVDELGNYLWGKNIGLADQIEWGIDLEEDSAGDFIIAGYTNTTLSGTYDGILIKTDHSGNIIWQKTYGSDDWDFFENMTLTSEGNIIVCGQKTANGSAQGWILMTSPDGAKLWETLIPGNGKVKLTGLDICPSESIIYPDLLIIGFPFFSVFLKAHSASHMLDLNTSEQSRPNASARVMPVISSAARLNEVTRQFASTVNTQIVLRYARLIAFTPARISW